MAIDAMITHLGYENGIANENINLIKLQEKPF